MEEKEVAIDKMEPWVKEEKLNSSKMLMAPDSGSQNEIKSGYTTQNINIKDIKENSEGFRVEDKFIINDTNIIDDDLNSLILKENSEEEHSLFDDPLYSSTLEVSQAETEETIIGESDSEEEDAISDHLLQFRTLFDVELSDEILEYIISELTDIEVEEPSIGEENTEELLTSDTTLSDSQKDDLEEYEDFILEEEPAIELSNKLLEFINMLIELDENEKQIDIILSDLDKHEKICIAMKKANFIFLRHFNNGFKRFEHFADIFAEKEEDLRKEKNWEIIGAKMAGKIVEAGDSDSSVLGKKNNILQVTKDDLEFLNSKFLSDEEQEKEEAVNKQDARKAKVKQSVGKKAKKNRKSKRKI